MPQGERPHDYLEGGEPANMDGKVALIVDKNRNGPTGVAIAEFVQERFLIQ
jgi:replicative DNA helicase